MVGILDQVRAAQLNQGATMIISVIYAKRGSSTDRTPTDNDNVDEDLGSGFSAANCLQSLAHFYQSISDGSCSINTLKHSHQSSPSLENILLYTSISLAYNILT